MIYRLGDLVDNFDSRRIPLSSMQRQNMSKKYPYYGATGIFDHVDDYIFDGDYLLLAEDGTVLRDNKYPVLQRISGQTWVNNHAHVLKAKEEIVLQDYLYYALYITDITPRVTGAVQLKLNQKNMNEIELEIPDLKTQHKIIRILSILDRKIDLNNSISDNLLRVSHQIYLNEIKNASITKTVRLGELCKIKYGKGLSMSKILENGYRVYGGNGIIGFYNEKMYNKSQILISCRGAASGKVIFTRPECFITNNSLILECDEKYHYFIKEFSLDREYYEYTTGSAQPQVTIDNVKDAELPLPNDEILINFNTALCPIEKKYFTILDENESLMELRDTLLPKLMSGMINIDRITANGEQ
jgi:hypothetical protein BACCOPRO_00080